MKNVLELLEERRAASRRRFLTTAGLVGAAAVGASMLPRRANAASGGASYTDPKKHTASINDILNFALNLEYLEAEFYLRAISGQGLAASDITGIDGTPGKTPSVKGTATPGTVTGGSQVNFSNSVVAKVANDIARDEMAHVLYLRQALGKFAVARPTIDLATSFTTAAVAAGIIPSGQTFNPFLNDDTFLIGAFIFEDVGVTAYHGAAPFLAGNKAVLASAAGILATEAYHGGAIRSLLAYRADQLNFPLDITAANDVSTLRATADGSGNGGNEEPLTDASGDVTIAPNDANGIAFARTFNEVLNIVYLGGAAGTGGGFFPTGLNGAIA